MEVKLFLDKMPYFNGLNNREAFNFLAQCEEAVEKMKASEVTIAWSKLAGRADRIMREEIRQHEGTVTWELFQSTLIKHLLSKERAASLLNKLQQDPHENIGEYVQRGSKIIQVHSGKTNLNSLQGMPPEVLVVLAKCSIEAPLLCHYSLHLNFLDYRCI